MPLKPPVWFWVVAVLLLLWALIGFVGFVLDPQVAGPVPAGMDAYDRQMYLGRPGWLTATYGIATTTALIGAALLLARRGAARPVFAVSLIAVVVMFGTILGTTDLIAHKGFATAAGLPIAIAVIGAVEIWFAGVGIRRGWLR